jgi:hypothetical protein
MVCFGENIQRAGRGFYHCHRGDSGPFHSPLDGSHGGFGRVLGDGTSTYFGHKGILGAFHSVSDTISEIAGLAVGSGNTYAELTLKDFQKQLVFCRQSTMMGQSGLCRRIFYNVVWPLAETAGVAESMKF